MTSSALIQQVAFVDLRGLTEVHRDDPGEQWGGELSLVIGENRNGMDSEDSGYQPTQCLELGTPQELDSGLRQMKGAGRGIQDVPTVAESKPPVAALNPAPFRVSESITSANSSPIILKAMARKVRLREGGGSSATRASLKKVITKSRRC